MTKYTPTQKRNLLAELVCLRHSLGYDIAGIMGLPLSKINFDKVVELIYELIEEWKESNYPKWEIENAVFIPSYAYDIIK